MRLVVDSAQLERMAERLETVAARIDASTAGPGQVQTQVTKQDFGGFLTGVCVASCIAAVALAMAILIIDNRSFEKMSKEIDDLKAWSDVHGNDIARLQAAQEAKK